MVKGHFSRIAGLCFILLLSGCSTVEVPQQQQTGSSSSTNTQQDKSASDHAQAMSRGQNVTVKTSQGEISVAPTVVAITDASGNAADSQGNQAQVFYNDPWENMNRHIFAFNNYAYDFVLIPAAEGYQFLVPAVARDKIGNAFNNIREPLNLLNNVVAGEFKDAGNNVGRFLINSTVGILGLFDPAQDWFDIAPRKQTIADTLFDYDVSAGPYLVLPLLGPSDSRGAFSTVSEGFIHPINQLMDPPESYMLRTFDGFDDFSGQAKTYQDLYQKADDPYIFFRNQYIQSQRRDEYFQYQGVTDDK
ncbi:MlaA family lipoprotein [Salinimonas lutimaris]|uniref:MlaA family lipoprotein n=1 Tax=Salinimonas lutimaris TaxID=914153 RepID=UPI0010C00B84|nr:VacJ family lipoprotein [Salinimonas lutimaris]